MTEREEPPVNFEQVWQQVLKIARIRQKIDTLSQGVRNLIVSVYEDAIIVSSERTGKIRELRKEDFRCLWEALTGKGQLNVDDIEENCYEQYWRKIGRIAMAFLAHLPNVEYSTRPKQTLYLMPYNTHPLGTKREKQAFRSGVRSFLSCRELKEAFKKAIKRYGEDENVLHYIGKGIKERGYLTPVDLFYIICWKAPSDDRSRGGAANNAFECIRRKGVEGIKAVTREAIELAKTEEVENSIEKLTELHGVSTKVASAVLTFYDPEKFGVVDKRAWKALYNEEKEFLSPKDYVKYLKDIRDLAKKCNVTPRNVDQALWYIGRKLWKASIGRA